MKHVDAFTIDAKILELLSPLFKDTSMMIREALYLMAILECSVPDKARAEIADIINQSTGVTKECQKFEFRSKPKH